MGTTVYRSQIAKTELQSLGAGDEYAPREAGKGTWDPTDVEGIG